jgi:hypothetical protein
VALCDWRRLSGKAQKVEDSAQKTQYLNMASSWHALAQELEGGNLDPEIAPGAYPIGKTATEIFRTTSKM